MQKIIPLFLAVLLLLPSASEGRSRTRHRHRPKPKPATEISLHELIGQATTLSGRARKIAKHAADQSIRETGRQVAILGKIASKESQEITEMASRARADQMVYERRVARGILKGSSSKRRVLAEVIRDVDLLARGAGRAATRVTGASADLIQRATVGAREATPHLEEEFNGALEDFRNYFGYIAAHPWKFDKQKGWRMVDGLVDRTNDLTRGTAQSVVTAIRPLLAAMEGDVRLIHDNKNEAERRLERADRIVYSSEADSPSSSPVGTDVSVVLSRDGDPREDKSVLPTFDIEHLNRRLVAPYYHEISSYRYNLHKQMRETVEEFDKRRPARPADAPDDPEPVPNVLK
ncbi:MAG TPA: hypothetical protein VFG95_03875 [Nitrospiria bacterium]|nr:hypothetical protein [Nitrospiria bacterium]